MQLRVLHEPNWTRENAIQCNEMKLASSGRRVCATLGDLIANCSGSHAG